MLEARTHNYLKKFLSKNPTNWKHLYSFGRIVASFVRKKENLLINSEIFLTQEWLPGILIALFLNQENAKFIISADKIKFILDKHLHLYKKLGFNFSVQNNQIIFSKHKIVLQTIDDLLNDFCQSNCEKQIIIFTDVDSFKKNLKKSLSITLCKKDWFNINDSYLREEKELFKTYDLLKEKFFLRSFQNQKLMSLNIEEINHLKKIINQNANYSDKFVKLNNAISSGWAFWIKLDHDKFEWSLVIEPIDQFAEINQLISKNNMIFLSSLRRDNFFKRFLNTHDIKLTSSISFESSFIEKNIIIYIPSKLLLPNNPCFIQSTIDNSKKLSFLVKGVSIFLINDNSFKIKLATELASICGQRVLIESPPTLDNQIVFSSYDWWINKLYLICPPDQIIIPLLPFPNMVEPINQETISSLKNQSINWFREFMLPEAFELIDMAVSPLRRNSGKLIFLDGRISNRKWGRDMLEMIQPQKLINYMYPFD